MGTEKEFKSYLKDFRYEKKTKIYTLAPNQEHCADNYTYSDGWGIENYILKVIKNSSDIADNSEELMMGAKNWASCYHLGAGRSNIIRTLNLPKEFRILELGSGCGSITRFLGENFESVDGVEGSYLRAQIAHERCRDLDNVKIFCSHIKSVKFEPIYDAVVLVGVLEYAPVYFNDTDPKGCSYLIKLAKSALKETGLLIIAIENKIGLKYWSGCPEDHTGNIFEGIHGYPLQNTPVTFSKREIEGLLCREGFQNIQFNYCFPDYKFATTIISNIKNGDDFYLHNWVEVPFKNYQPSHKYIFHEGLALKTLSQAGILREFANSFLLIASQTPMYASRLPDWVAKKFTMFDRDKKHWCITTLKTKPHLHIHKEKLEEEKNFINSQYKENKLINTPWYKGDLLIFELYKLCFENNFKTKLMILMEEYYQVLFKQYSTGNMDKEGYPLMKSNSIDFIFRNIIRSGRDLLSIDEEWVSGELTTADYVLYRCIKHDIIKSQFLLKRRRINNPEQFIIKLIKEFFPQYNKKRHRRNKILEKSFQNSVTIDFGLGRVHKIRKFPLLKNKVVWNIAKKIWEITPEYIKYKIKDQ